MKTCHCRKRYSWSLTSKFSLTNLPLTLPSRVYAVNKFSFTISFVVRVHGNIYLSGENLGGAGERPPPPPPSRKMTNFRKFWAKRGLKTAFSSANGGGGGLPEIWKFCRKFRRLWPPPPPPPPEEVNFRHWPPFVCKNHRLKNFLCTCQVFLMMAAVRTNKFSL
jgi:hypothetical protein